MAENIIKPRECDKEHNTVVLAALMHDIGKFRQRTGSKIENDYDESCCPIFNKRLSHLHAGHTGKCLSEINAPGEIIDMAARHHIGEEHLANEKDGYLTTIIKKADWMASGLDREGINIYNNNTDDAKDRISKEQQNYKTARLESIFSQININNVENAGNSRERSYRFCRLDTLTPENSCPVDKAEGDYSGYYEKFKKEAKGVFNSIGSPDDNFNQYYLSVQSLLEKYTWCIPSSAYKVFPNISLFDHSRITAAFADALYAYHKSNKQMSYKDIMVGDIKASKYMLIQGDYSG
ncbi:MAG: HD domain-containing protein, partial [Candidatus Margulisiibacteriota bacterium]